MGGFGRVFAGALQGIGQGLVMQGQERAKSAAEEAAGRREIALQNMRAQAANELAATQHGYKVTELEKGADLDDWKDARKTGRTTDATIKIDKAKTDNDVVMEGVRASNAQVLAKLNGRLDLTRQQALEAQRFSNSLAEAGMMADRYEVAADGSMVAYNKRGAIIDQSEPGKFTPRAAGGSDSGSSGSGALARARTEAGATPTPAATPAASTAKSKPPRIGEIREGHRYDGGDPAAQSSWTKIK